MTSSQVDSLEMSTGPATHDYSGSPQLKHNTNMSDYLDAIFVNEITSLGSACTWQDLDEFISNGRQKINHDIPHATYKESNNFLSPTARKSQLDIERIHNESSPEFDNFGTSLSFDDEAVEGTNKSEDYGDVNRDAIRKSIIERIDSILDSRMYPDRYVSDLDRGVRKLVNDIVNERNIENGNDMTYDEKHRFDFPGDECGHDEPPAKRKKNVLG